MNKWYRLGQKFANKFSYKQFYEVLRDNNYTNALGCIGKDIKEKDYIKLCKIVGVTPEEPENIHYCHGERKYYFVWGFDNEKN